MLSLPVITWVRFLVWLDIGFVIYWFYGRTHSPLADAKGDQAPLAAAEPWRTSSPCSGLLGLFNGFCIFLLGLLTELGVTNEITAKWSELNELTERFFGLHVNAETSDTFGLQALAVGAAVFAAGWVLAKASRK